jgi:hypothetical protein
MLTFLSKWDPHIFIRKKNKLLKKANNDDTGAHNSKQIFLKLLEKLKKV